MHELPEVLEYIILQRVDGPAWFTVNPCRTEFTLGKYMFIFYAWLLMSWETKNQGVTAPLLHTDTICNLLPERIEAETK